MKKELSSHLHSFTDKQKEKIIKTACNTYWSTTELNSSAASQYLYKFLKNNDNSLKDKWNKLEFYLSQTQHANRKLYKILLEGIEAEVSKTDTDIRFETGRISSSMAAIAATVTLESLRFGWEYGFWLGCTIVGLPVFPLAIAVSAVVGLVGGIGHAIVCRPLSVEEQHDLFQRLKSIEDDHTKKQVLKAIKQEFMREESFFGDGSDDFIKNLDDENVNSFNMIRAYVTSPQGLLNGTKLLRVIKKVIMDDIEKPRQVLPEFNLEAQAEPECDGLNTTQKQAVIQEIAMAYGNSRLGSSQERKNVINTLEDEKISTEEKWTELNKFISEPSKAPRGLRQIVSKEIDLEISKTDISHRVNKNLISDKKSHYGFFVGKSITNSLDKARGITVKTCGNLRGGSLLAIPMAPAALVMGGVAGVGHGIFKACTRNPISIAQYQELFTKLNVIDDAGVKTKIIETVLIRYHNTWHLSQSDSSFKLVNKLSAKRLDCHEKFNYLKEYMTSQADQYIYNNGKKLFNIIKETVLAETAAKQALHAASL